VSNHARFFADIAEALLDVEIILQNAPQPRGAGLSPEAILQIVKTIPMLTYIKEETLPSGPRISALLDGAPRHLRGVFGGGGARHIVDELNRGALGAMPAVEIADLHVALFRAYTEKDGSAMRRLYRMSLPLLTAQAVYRMRLTKHVLMRRQVTQGQYVRAPLPVLDELAIRDIDRMLDDLQRDAAIDKAFPWTKVP
jgi:4-hydroxy-tetrahydrodipicolinate synthase